METGSIVDDLDGQMRWIADWLGIEVDEARWHSVWMIGAAV